MTSRPRRSVPVVGVTLAVLVAAATFAVEPPAARGQSEPAACRVGSKPDDTAAEAQLIRIAECGDSGIAIAASFDAASSDYYRLSVPAEPATLRDITVVPATETQHEVCLLSAMSELRQCHGSADAATLQDLLLEPGDHLIWVRGGTPDVEYELRIEATGPWDPSREAEPNDGLYVASPFDLETGVEGRTSSGLDVFAATVAGPTRLWDVTLTGERVTRLRLRNERRHLAEGAIDPSGQRAVLSDLALTPGTHYFEVGADGPYELRAQALGDLVSDAELEPNNDPALANAIRIGDRRIGRTPGPFDIDIFRFTAAAPEHVVVALSQAPDADIELRLTSGGTQLIRLRAHEPGAPIELDLVLPAGDHEISLVPIVPSPGRYELLTRRADPFRSPDDREPNDLPEFAAPLPETLRWTGQADGIGDVDRYELPPLAAGGPLSITVDPPATSVQLFVDGAVVPGEVAADGDRVWARAPAQGGVLEVVAAGEYALAIAVDGLTAMPLPATPELELSLTMETGAVAAYSQHGQRVEGELVLMNAGDTALELSLEAITSHYAWSAHLGQASVRVAAGAETTVPISVEIADDAWADTVRISVAARTPDAGSITTAAEIRAETGAIPVGLRTGWRLPEALLGGLDVASLALGASPLPVAEAEDRDALHDGLTPIAGGFRVPWQGQPIDIPIDLAGSAPLPIVGMVLNPLALAHDLRGAPRDVELFLSLDGSTWTSALSAAMEPIPIDQPFVLDVPVSATHAMLRIHSTHGPRNAILGLGEWKVVAEPGIEPDPMPRNIAAPSRGGHVVRYTPFAQDLGPGYRMLDGDLAPERLTVRPAGAGFEAIVGFAEGRAAQIERLVLRDPDGSDPTLRLEAIEVEVALDGPLGPWQPVGTWELARGDSGVAPPFVFDEPRWARFVRLSRQIGEDASVLELPAVIEVHERAADDGYRSILAEWGRESSHGPLEWTRPLQPQAPAPLDTVGDGPVEAAPLPVGHIVAERVTIGEDEDWYLIDVPPGANAIDLDVTGEADIGLDIEVSDIAGDSMPVRRLPQPGRAIRYEAVVPGGGSYLVRVAQPPASIVFALDVSESMGPFFELVFGAMTAFAADVVPGQEAVHVIPFAGPPLLDDWSDDPFTLQAAIRDFRLRDAHGLSNAEETLIDATRRLGERDGRRAILVITDVASPTENLTPELWDGLGEVRPMIHALQTLLGSTGGPQRDRIRAWGHSSGGYYENVTTQGEMNRAMERLAAWLRRPADYTLMASTSTREHLPGRLLVELDDDTPGLALAPDLGVEIILDTSGSMRKKLAGERRIDVAREALVRLVNDTLPEGVPVALRTFGGKGSGKKARCRTRLTVPLVPLEAAPMLERLVALKARKGTATPIASAIEQAAADLAATDGSRIVVLVTDGDETCKGDPEAVVQRLRQEGVDLTLNIVGFALDDEDLKEMMSSWATSGGGAYFDANGQAELSGAIAAALARPVTIRDASGAVVALSTLGGPPLELAPGVYRVSVRAQPELEFETVFVRPEETTRLLVTAADIGA